MDRIAVLFRRPATDPRTDGQLLAAFLGDRDDPAFAELVRRHGPLVWGVCCRALPDRADAEDAFQASFLVLVRKAGRLTGSPTVGPWLFKVAASVARNARRKNARRFARAVPLPDGIAAPRPPESNLDLDAALLGLPGRCRAAILLCYLEGLTHREAADRLGCPEGTVSSLVSRGLARVRAKLAGRNPAALLTVAAAAAPAGLANATARSAVAFHLASSSAAASPAVVALAHGVLRMFWLRKATAAGLAAVVLLAAGVGVGVSVRHTPQAVGQEKPVVKNPDPPGAGAAAPGAPTAPFLVLTVRGLDGARSPYTLTEFDARGKALWSVTPGADLAEKPKADGVVLDLKDLPTQQAVVAAAREYLTRVKKDPNAPQDLRVVFDNDAQVGGFSIEAMKCCLDAGFEKIRFTGYVPLGGFIPQLKPGPDGEAEGYKRYKGELVDTKKLLTDYAEALRRL